MPETITSRDAARFPIIASCTLLGLYLFFKVSPSLPRELYFLSGHLEETAAELSQAQKPAQSCRWLPLPAAASASRALVPLLCPRVAGPGESGAFVADTPLPY